MSAETPEGDLSFPYSCWAAIADYSEPYLELTLYVTIHVEGNTIAVGSASGYGYIEATASGSVGAADHNRTVQCDAFTTFGGLHDEQLLEGSGPPTAQVWADAFIPQQWVWSPASSSEILWGDNRSFCLGCGSSRIQSDVTVVNTAYNGANPPMDGGPSNGHGISMNFDAESSLDSGWILREEAINDWVWGWPYKLTWGWASLDETYCDWPVRLGANGDESGAGVHCTGHASDPLILFSPNIDYNYNVSLWFGRNRIRYEVDGCHDAYPSHTLYIRGQPIVLHTASGNPLDLIPICGQGVFQTGEVQ